ncbi:MAG: efflux transporter outer membrane subunit [Desulfobulbus sp.]|nr:efflux transporter outer membrane subunit [Desulfobulbus sp.]
MRCLHCLSNILVCLSLILAGCSSAVHTSYVQPAMTIPHTWSSTSSRHTPYKDCWWLHFNDPALNELISLALRSNAELAVAALRLQNALLQAELADSNRLPSLQAEGSATYSRDLQRHQPENTRFGASIFSSYAVDLWGKLSADAEAAHWQAQATKEDLENTVLALTGTTASLYWQLRYLHKRIALSSASIEYTRRSLELATVRYAAGAVSILDLLEAERLLASQQADHALLLQQQSEVENELNIVLDRPPQQSMIITRPAADLLLTDIPEVEAGLPVHLLARRPDLRAAEARLRSTLAMSNAVKASFYPSLTLSGNLGQSSDELSRLLNNPIGTAIASLTLPFLQWRDMQRSIRISDTEYEQASIGFRQTLYNALVEVENGLSARQRYKEESFELLKTLEAARRAEDFYEIRYRAGKTALKSWLDAQESRRQAEIRITGNQLNQLQNHITLIKALGGGTDEYSHCSTKTPE